MKRILIIILAVVIVGGAAAYYFLIYKEEPSVNTNAGIEYNINAGQDTNTADNSNASQNENVNTSEKTDIDLIKEKALPFAERYGSYSNKNDFEHLINLKDWMTANFQIETDNYIALEQAKMTGQEDYLAILTKVISMSVSNLGSSAADCLVSVQRTERNESVTTDNYFQNLLLKFKKENDAWKVNGAVWQEKTVIE